MGIKQTNCTLYKNQGRLKIYCVILSCHFIHWQRGGCTCLVSWIPCDRKWASSARTWPASGPAWPGSPRQSTQVGQQCKITFVCLVVFVVSAVSWMIHFFGLISWISLICLISLINWIYLISSISLIIWEKLWVESA